MSFANVSHKNHKNLVVPADQELQDTSIAVRMETVRTSGEQPATFL